MTTDRKLIMRKISLAEELKNVSEAESIVQRRSCGTILPRPAGALKGGAAAASGPTPAGAARVCYGELARPSGLRAVSRASHFPRP